MYPCAALFLCFVVTTCVYPSIAALVVSSNYPIVNFLDRKFRRESIFVLLKMDNVRFSARFFVFRIFCAGRHLFALQYMRIFWSCFSWFNSKSKSIILVKNIPRRPFAPPKWKFFLCWTLICADIEIFQVLNIAVFTGGFTAKLPRPVLIFNRVRETTMKKFAGFYKKIFTNKFTPYLSNMIENIYLSAKVIVTGGAIDKSRRQ